MSTLVQELLNSDIQIHCMRDLTRGGLASGLIELATTSKYQFEIDEALIPVYDGVKMACEILGFDPLYIANEGCFVLFVAEADSDKALAVMNQHTLGTQACVIGKVHGSDAKGIVTLETALGVNRVLDLFSGEQLPRIC